jgi:hypothetical protein
MLLLFFFCNWTSNGRVLFKAFAGRLAVLGHRLPVLHVHEHLDDQVRRDDAILGFC